MPDGSVACEEVMTLDISQPMADLDAYQQRIQALMDQQAELDDALASMNGADPFAGLTAGLQTASDQIDALLAQTRELNAPVDMKVGVADEAAAPLAALQDQVDALRAPVVIPVSSAGGVAAGGESAAARDTEASGAGAAGGGGLMGFLMSPQGLTAIASAVVGAVRVVGAARIQEQMTQNVAGGGLDPAVAAQVQQSIMQMAPELGVSPGALNKAVYPIASAGFSHGTDTTQVLQSSAEAGKLSGADQTTVASGLTTVLNQYGMGGDMAQGVAGQLVTAVSLGKMTMEDFTASLGKLLTTAGALHIPFEDAAAAEDVLTTKGIDSANAATAVNQALKSLSDPSGPAKAAMIDLGVSLDDVKAELGSGDMIGAITDFSDALEAKLPASAKDAIEAMTANLANGMDPDAAMSGLAATLGPAYANVMSDIIASFGGTRGGAFALNVISPEGMDTLKADALAIGDTQEAATKLTDAWTLSQADFLQQWSKLTAGIEVGADTIGANLLPVLTPLVQTLADDLPGAIATAGDAWNTLAEAFAVGGRTGLLVLTDMLGAIGSTLGSAAEQITAWFVEAWGKINWSLVWSAATSLGTDLLTSGLVIANDLGTWIGQQWGKINWPLVWANATTLFQNLYDWSATVLTDAATWVGAQWNRVNWADVWAQATTFGAGLETSGLNISGNIETWLGLQWAEINWPSIFSTAGTLIDDFNTWLNGLDWASAGQHFADWLTATIPPALETAVPAAIVVSFKILETSVVIAKALTEFAAAFVGTLIFDISEAIVTSGLAQILTPSLYAAATAYQQQQQIGQANAALNGGQNQTPGAGYQSMQPQASYAATQTGGFTGTQSQNMQIATLGVGAEETSLGTAGVGLSGNNLFSMMDSGDKGTDSGGFAVYSSTQASMDAFVTLMKTPRYAGALADILAGNFGAVPQDLMSEGYAMPSDTNFIGTLSSTLPAAKSALGYDQGGVLYEPVMGKGLVTGTRYSFAETGPEEFGGVGKVGAASGAPQFNFTIHAEGAQQGVAEQIKRELMDFADTLVGSWKNMAAARGQHA